MSDLKKIGSLLILIGGIIGLIQGILMILGSPFSIFPGVGDLGLTSLIRGILLIIFSLVALASSGYVKISALNFGNSWVVVLVMGILMYVFGSDLGGILVIVGAILWLL
jgi:hypothetical protein